MSEILYSKSKRLELLEAAIKAEREGNYTESERLINSLPVWDEIQRTLFNLIHAEIVSCEGADTSKLYFMPYKELPHEEQSTVIKAFIDAKGDNELRHGISEYMRGALDSFPVFSTQ